MMPTILPIEDAEITKILTNQFKKSKMKVYTDSRVQSVVQTGNGIKVTNIYPGETNTPIIDKRPTPPPAEKRAQMLQPEDIAACVIAVAKLPPRAVVPELVVTPPYMMID